MSIVGILVLVGCVWFLIGILRWRKLNKSFSNQDLDGVRLWLGRLYESREPGAYLIFEDMDASKRFVQFRREVGADGATLTCDFPIAPWSKAYSQSLKALLNNLGIAYSEILGIAYSEVQPAVGQPLERFIVIKKLGAEDAARLTNLVFRQVFGHSALSVRVWGNRLSGPKSKSTD